MKIVYIITKSEVGGAQVHVRDLIEHFKKNNDVFLIVDKNGWLADYASKNNVQVLYNKYFSNSLNPINSILATVRTRQLLKQISPDLIHCHSSAAGLYGRLANFNSRPIIYTAHGWGFNVGVGIFQKTLAIITESLLSGLCDKVVCVSGFVKDLALKYGVVNHKKLVVIYNGVSDLGIKNENKDKFNFVFLGRLAAPKLPILAVNLFLNLPKNIQEVSNLTIVGDGNYRGVLENIIKQKNLNNIFLAGAAEHSKAVSILKNSDLLLLFSNWEGLPISIIEAMSVGLPIVASDVGGIKELVSKENGLLIRNSDLKPAVYFIEKIFSDRNYYKEISNNARKKYFEKFTLEKMLSATKNVYEEVSGFDC